METSEKNAAAIRAWVTDIKNLVSHIEEALDAQLEIKSTNASVSNLIQKIHDQVRDDKKRAESYEEKIGPGGGSAVLQAGAEMLGKAAGLIDKMRTEKASKALRDDYTALNSAVIAYTMLHTTAMAVRDEQTKLFAETGMRTYAGLIQDINEVMPQAVVDDLIGSGDVEVEDSNVVEACRDEIDRIWSETRNA